VNFAEYTGAFVSSNSSLSIVAKGEEDPDLYKAILSTESKSAAAATVKSTFTSFTVTFSLLAFTLNDNTSEVVHSSIRLFEPFFVFFTVISQAA